MNPPYIRRLTVGEISEPLIRLEAEYNAYRKAAERYHLQTQKILGNILDLMPKLKHSLSSSEAPAPAGSNKTNVRKIAATLTKREIQVLGLVAAGNSTKQVASNLGITFKTAVGHRSRLMAKLSIHDTASLVRYAIRVGLIEA